MLPELSKDNSDRWFDRVTEALHAKKMWWIIAAPETADYSAHMAISTLLRSIVPDSESDLLDEHLGSAANQFNALKHRWQTLRPNAARHKITAFYNYKKPEDVSIRTAYEQLKKMAKTLRAQDSAYKDALAEDKVFQQLLASLPSEYAAVRDTIDRQPVDREDIESALDKLEVKEDELQDKSAHLAMDRRHKGSYRKGGRPNYRSRRSSGSSSGGSPRTK
jgi:predicted nuclease with TOPRIM domain